jgi:hypothetical protein
MNAPVKSPPTSFAEAFCKLQAAIRPAIKDATNPAFRSKYADLSAVWEAVRAPLADNGFSVIQSTDFDEKDLWLKTTVLHVSGDKIEGRYPLRPTKQDPQGFGSAMTYAKRYSLAAMLGVVADEDDDGNAASQSVTKPAQQAAPQQYDDADGQMKAWCDAQKTFLTNCEEISDVQAWEELRADALGRLKRKNLPAWSDLQRFKENRIGNINLKPTKEAAE